MLTAGSVEYKERIKETVVLKIVKHTRVYIGMITWCCKFYSYPELVIVVYEQFQVTVDYLTWSNKNNRQRENR